MKKIPSLFVRDRATGLVTDEVTAGCEWVVNGEGVATRKLDGTCCLVRDGKLFKRHEVKPGGKTPPDFEAAGDVDENTGKTQGWVPVGGGPEDRWHREAFAATAPLYRGGVVPDGTYELLGPKVQGNPERRPTHTLERHGAELFMMPVPRDHAGLRAYLAALDMEGIVWHHDDGRACKVKTKDFGLKRPPGAKS